jgi:hypothetical protein
MFQKATKKQSRARIGLCGPAGSGKTYTGLLLATNLGQRVAVIDTERGSASKYADEFQFDVVELDYFDPRRYVEAIRAAEQAGYDVCLIDSLSHAWNAEGGVLQLVDQAEMRQKFTKGWREATPIHNQLVNAMLQSRMHIIATMRAKTEYVVEKDRNGNSVPRKIGLAPIQRDGMEYEFDIMADLDWDNNLIVTKTRCRALAGKTINKPGSDVARIVNDWLSDGTPAPQAVPPTRPADVSYAMPYDNDGPPLHANTPVEAPRLVPQPSVPFEERATQRQLRALERLVDERGIDLEGEIRARFGDRVLGDLSMDEAGQLLSEWQQRPRKPVGVR